MLRKLLVIAVLCLTLLTPPRASANLPVIDATNLVQNIRSFIQMLQAYEQDYQHYVKWAQQYADLKDNWKTRAIGYLLIEESRSRDNRMGFSAIAAARYLNADAGDWRDSIEALLRAHYAMPKLSSQITDALETHDGSIAGLVGEYQRLYKQRTPLLDAYHFLATQRAAAKNRSDTLTDVQRMLDGLGARSETQQLQAIGSALTVIARQNEASMDAMQMQLSQNQRDQLERIDGEERYRQAKTALLRANRLVTSPCGSTGCISHTVW
jgi:hypothetical protein